MTKFLQMDEQGININHIVYIRHYVVGESDRVEIELANGRQLLYTNAEARRFMHWWREHAEVYAA